MVVKLFVGIEAANSTVKSFSNAVKGGHTECYYNTATELNGDREALAGSELQEVYSYKGKQFEVGKAEGDSSSNSGSNKYNEQYITESVINLYKHVEKSIEGNGHSEHKLVVVIGLPEAHYGDEKIENYIIANLKTNHVVNGVSFEVVDVDFMLQPLGTYYSLLFNLETFEANKLADELLDEDYVLLVNDLGFGTLDLTVLRQTEKLDDYGTNLGVSWAIDRIKKHAEKIGGASFKSVGLSNLQIDKQIRKALEKGEEKILIGKGKTKVDVTQKVEEEFADLTNKIISTWDVGEYSYDDYEFIILTGGGSTLLRKYFEKYAQEHGDNRRFFYVDDHVKSGAQMANAIGYYIQANFNAKALKEEGVLR